MLYLLVSILQEIPDSVVDGVLKINPYNATAYGGLVLVLIIFLYLQYKDKQKQADSLEKISEILGDMHIAMASMAELKQMILAKLLNNNPPN